MSDVEQTPAPQAPPAPAGNGKDPGAPSGFGSAFADAVIAAVREQEGAQAQGQIATALGLGWYLAALSHPADVVVTAAGARGDLVGAAGAGDDAVLAFCRQHVEVALTRLKKVLDEAAPDEDGRLKTLRDCVASAEAAARREAAEELDGRLLAILSAVDFRLSKAYAVGRGLMNLTTRPEPDTKLADHLTAANVAPLVADIDDLSSALPAHAGHSVRDSVLEWRDSVRERQRGRPRGARDVAGAGAAGRAVAGDAGRREVGPRHARDRGLPRRGRPPVAPHAVAGAEGAAAVPGAHRDRAVPARRPASC